MAEKLVWRADFPDGCTMYLTANSWTVDGPNPMAVHDLKSRFAGHLTEVPWPQPAGFSLDITPGWEPKLMYDRLLSIGAMNVVGPRPPEPEIEPEPGVIVG
jgi:hypothetical protein